MVRSKRACSRGCRASVPKPFPALTQLTRTPAPRRFEPRVTITRYNHSELHAFAAGARGAGRRWRPCRQGERIPYILARCRRLCLALKQPRPDIIVFSQPAH